VTAIIDCDQHLYESRSLWADHVEPVDRAEALRIEDDDLGYSWLTWREQRLELADVHLPGDTASCGRLRQRRREELAPEYRYDDALPDDYWEPAARARRLADLGVDEAVLFPNFGLLWERRLSQSLPALTANMSAWNRWCGTVVEEGGGRLHPVAHLTLRDPAWLEAQVAELSATGVRLAMIAPALVDGKPLSHPDHDRLWSAFVAGGVTPVFHVADQPHVFGDAWYTDSEYAFVPAIEAVFLWTPPALALTDLIVNGTLDRHPELRIGVVELTASWVPWFLPMLDGSLDFLAKLNGRTVCDLELRPSEYFRRQVRVAAFAHEDPKRIRAGSDDLFMCCSDYPHSEGTATPIDDYRAVQITPDAEPALFNDNISFLLR
jgi:predicted TIM-barrel fold metal-dependent hydrolase